MIRIPAGEWQVGSTKEERESLASKYGFHPSLLGDELDARTVSLPEFFIDEYPVTNAQYAAFIKATGAPEPYDWPLHGIAARSDHPVAGVGGEDARAYAKWVGKRLPSPEEWEAACQGIPEIPDRPASGSHWTPETHASESDPGPVSAHGVHGYGQVCEWTTATQTKGEFPFRLKKGAWWMCNEAWTRRPAMGSWAFAPWCRQWTGLRCAADTDVPSVPTATLPETGMENYHARPADATQDAVQLFNAGGAGLSVGLPGILERLGLAAPEGWTVNGEPVRDIEVVSDPAACEGPRANVAYSLKAAGVTLNVNARAGRDFFDMDYTVDNSRAEPVSTCPSACVCAGLMDPFHDFQGARSFISFDGDDWMPLRALPREGATKRWICYLTLPPGPHTSVLVGVAGKDGDFAFGYGRAGLTAPLKAANNYCFSCLHLDPEIPVPAAGSITTRSRIYAIRGTLSDLLGRFRNDFGLST